MYCIKSDLGVLGIKIARVHGYHFVRMSNWKYIGRVILHVYLVDDEHEKFRIIQILDICMKPKCTRLGIGTQLITLVTEIAKQNSAKYIFGILEANGDLDARKHFFVKNGFELVKNKHFGLSHICAKKTLAN